MQGSVRRRFECPFVENDEALPKRRQQVNRGRVTDRHAERDHPANVAGSAGKLGSKKVAVKL